MPIEFSRIKDNQHFNRFYGSEATARSGYSTAPYTLGWNNRYGPPGANERVNVDCYDISANPGNVINSGIEGSTSAAMHLLNTPYAPWIGPTNNIYKITIAGIKNDTNPLNSGACADCDRLNGTYYVNRSVESMGTTSYQEPPAGQFNNQSLSMPYLYLSNNGSFAARNLNDGSLWYAPIAKETDIDTPCGNQFNGYHNLLSVSQDRGYIYQPTSEFVNLFLAQYPVGTNSVGSRTGTVALYVSIGAAINQTPGINGYENYTYNAAFRKSFGQLNLHDVHDFPEDSKKRPLMLEGYHDLEPYTDSIPTTAFSFSLVRQTQPRNSGDNQCDWSTATCRVEPYKTTDWDYRQTRYYFENPYGLPVFLSPMASCNGYGYRYALAPTGFLHYIPGAFQLSFEGITNRKTNPLCVDCSGYFHEPITLKATQISPLENLNTGNTGSTVITQRYEWRGNDAEDLPTFGTGASYISKYNICEYGCYSYIKNRIGTGGQFGINNGNQAGLLLPGSGYESYCSQKIRLDIVTSGTAIATTGFRTMSSIATLSIMNGAVIGPTFTKVLCDNSTSTKCYQNTGSHFINETDGLVNCLSSSTYDGGWVADTGLRFDRTNNVSSMESGVYYNTAVSHLCDFTNATPILTPNNSFSYQRQANRHNPCIVCTDKTFPNTLTVQYASISGSYTKIYTRNGNRCGFNDNPTLVNYPDTFIADWESVGFGTPTNRLSFNIPLESTISGGSLAGGKTWTISGFGANGGLYTHVIGPNIGTFTNQKLDCANGSWVVTSGVTGTNGPAPLNTLPFTVTATVSDFLPITYP